MLTHLAEQRLLIDNIMTGLESNNIEMSAQSAANRYESIDAVQVNYTRFEEIEQDLNLLTLEIGKHSGHHEADLNRTALLYDRWGGCRPIDVVQSFYRPARCGALTSRRRSTQRTKMCDDSARE